MTMQTALRAKSRRPVSLWALLCRNLSEGYERGRQRRALATLSDTQLQDIGLTRSDVMEETAKPFWTV
jgi:uncharacterized protein YjiS (DUF1127 family)